MATLREIRRKLQSVTNIEKITQAMELVAASRLRKAQAKAEMSRPYARKLKEILERLVLVTDHFAHPLLNQRDVQKIGVVVVSGDKGLCGSYNQMIFSRTEKFLKKYSPEQVELILVGQKAIDYFGSRKWKTNPRLTGWGGKITYPEIVEFTRELMDRYVEEEFDEIRIIYTHFVNAAVRQVKVEKLLPIENPEIEDHIKKVPYIYEPCVPEIFNEILPRYCITLVQTALNEAYASELAARVFSMRAATNNAEEMIQKLTLIRNKVRQSNITRELIEITATLDR